MVEVTVSNKNIGSCNACGGVVSKKAKACPHCGQKKPFKKVVEPTSPKKMLIYIGIGFLIASPALFGGNPTPSRSPSKQGGEEGRSLCETAIHASVNNPSTVDIKSFSGYGSDVSADGTRRITQSFSAKNSFGLEQHYTAYCKFTADGKFDIKIQEDGR